MAQIPLNFDAVAVVDDADYERVKSYDWFLSGSGYAVGFVLADGKFKLVYLQRFLMNAQPGEVVDHVNGCALDNRRANLRPSSTGSRITLTSSSSAPVLPLP